MRNTKTLFNSIATYAGEVRNMPIWENRNTNIVYGYRNIEIFYADEYAIIITSKEQMWESLFQWTLYELPVKLQRIWEELFKRWTTISQNMDWNFMIFMYGFVRSMYLLKQVLTRIEYDVKKTKNRINTIGKGSRILRLVYYRYYGMVRRIMMTFVIIIMNRMLVKRRGYSPISLFFEKLADKLVTIVRYAIQKIKNAFVNIACLSIYIINVLINLMRMYTPRSLKRSIFNFLQRSPRGMRQGRNYLYRRGRRVFTIPPMVWQEGNVEENDEADIVMSPAIDSNIDRYIQDDAILSIAIITTIGTTTTTANTLELPTIEEEKYEDVVESVHSSSSVHSIHSGHSVDSIDTLESIESLPSIPLVPPVQAIPSVQAIPPVQAIQQVQAIPSAVSTDAHNKLKNGIHFAWNYRRPDQSKVAIYRKFGFFHRDAKPEKQLFPVPNTSRIGTRPTSNPFFSQGSSFFQLNRHVSGSGQNGRVFKWVNISNEDRVHVVGYKVFVEYPNISEKSYTGVRRLVQEYQPNVNSPVYIPPTTNEYHTISKIRVSILLQTITESQRDSRCSLSVRESGAFAGNNEITKTSFVKDASFKEIVLVCGKGYYSNIFQDIGNKVLVRNGAQEFKGEDNDTIFVIPNDLRKKIEKSWVGKVTKEVFGFVQGSHGNSGVKGQKYLGPLVEHTPRESAYHISKMARASGKARQPCVSTQHKPEVSVMELNRRILGMHHFMLFDEASSGHGFPPFYVIPEVVKRDNQPDVTHQFVELNLNRATDVRRAQHVDRSNVRSNTTTGEALTSRSNVGFEWIDLLD
jgi:hypothetical protein